MKRTFVYDQLLDRMVEVTAQDRVHTHEVIPELKPYRSQVDGTVIDSRAKHREHLKKHGLRQVDPSEVTKEKIMNYQPNYDVAPEQRRELIRAQIDAMPHEEFKRALKRDIDRVIWNSRK